MTSRQIQIALALLLAALIGMGAYAYRLVNRVGDKTVPAESRPMTPPVAANSERAVLMLASDRTGHLQSQEVAASLPSDPRASGSRSGRT